MPGKKLKASASSSKTKADLTATDNPCAVCTNGIPADEVATCDECKKTSHRYCAGVPFEEFVNSDGVFTCLSCLKMLYKKQQVLTETMSDCISALKVEISELRSALKDIESAGVSVSTDRDQESEPAQKRSAPDRQWTTVGSGRRGRKRHQKFTKANLPAGSAPSSSLRTDGRRLIDTSAPPAETNIRSSTSDKEKVIIEGKRKVWGTLRATSAGAVKNTIKALSKIEAAFEVKRKYHLRNGRGTNVQASKWWFIISGEETVLKQLSDGWNTVKLQTN